MFLLTTSLAWGQEYTFDWTESELIARVDKDESALGSEVSHDHAILAVNWSGTARFGAEGCSLEVTVPVNGLTPDLPAIREKQGMDVMLTEPQRKQVGEHLRGSDQLDAANHPEITFVSTSCSHTQKSMTVTGDLTIRGVTQSVDLKLKRMASLEEISLVGTLRIAHTDFGFEPYSAMMGALRNADPITVTIIARGAAS